VRGGSLCYRSRVARRVSRRGAAAGRGLLAAALVAASAAAALAEEPPPPAPSNYVAGFVGTTLDYRPPGGSWDGWQHDVTPLLGYGRQLRPTLALELDVGPTFVRGEYSTFSLTPGLVWSVHPNLYLAARFVVPVDPEANFVLFPGVGLSCAFGRVMPVLELNVSSAVGRGDPDLGVSLTAGVLVFF
jgi:hypothetical protein